MHTVLFLNFTSTLIIVISIILLFVAVVLIVMINRIIREKSKFEYQNQLLKLNPHFIFNSLTAIQNYVLTNDIQLASKYLTNLARLIRLTLDNTRLDLVTLDKEINYLKLFLEIQSLRFEGRFTTSLNVDSKINPELISIPPMLFQPFLDNAVEHGYIRFSKNSQLNINFKINSGWLDIEIEDIGELVNIEKLNEKYTPSMHLNNTIEVANQRINIINKYKRLNIKLIINDNYKSLNSLIGISIKYQIPL